MKNLSTALLSVILTISPTLLFAETIKIVTNDWEPYNTVDGQGTVDKVVKEAFALMGYNVEYIVMPWRRAYETVKSGDADITYPWTYMDERNAEILFNRTPLIINRSVFWHRADHSFQWNDYTDLTKYRIGGMIGHTDTDILSNNGVKVATVSDELTNLRKLLANRIDAFAMNEVVGQSIIESALNETEKSLLSIYQDKALVEERMHAVFSPNSRGEKLADDFERGLAMLIESGRYGVLMETK